MHYAHGVQIVDCIQNLSNEPTGIHLCVEAFLYDAVKQLTSRHPNTINNTRLVYFRILLNVEYLITSDWFHVKTLWIQIVYRMIGILSSPCRLTCQLQIAWHMNMGKHLLLCFNSPLVRQCIPAYICEHLSPCVPAFNFRPCTRKRTVHGVDKIIEISYSIWCKSLKGKW